MPKLEALILDILTNPDLKGIDEAEKRVLGFSQKSVDASKAIAVGFLGIGTAVAGFAGFGIKMAGDMEAARQGFVALLGSADKADATMSRIKKEAASTPFELPGLVAGTQALAAITKDGDKAIDMLLDVGKAVAVSGKGQAELDRIVLNLQQISSTGKVTAMDIRQFQGAIPIFNDIVEGAGMTVEQLQNADNAAELLGLAFKAAGEKGGIAAEGFTAQAGTWNQLFSNFKDNIGIAAAEFVTTTGIFEGAKQVLGGLVEGIGFLTGAMKLLVTGDFNKAISDMMGGLDEDSPIVAGLLKIRDLFMENKGLFVIVAGTIFAMLVPAFISLASAAWLALAPIIAFAAPFILIGALVAALYVAFNQNFLGIKDIVFGVVDWFISYVWPTMQKIFNFIGAVVTTLGQIFTNIFNLVIKPLLSLFVAFFEFTFWKPLKGFFDLITGALHAMGYTWSDVWEGVKKMVFGVFEAIVSFIKNKINSIIDFINMLIGGANKVGDKIPGYTHINEIPKLASGTRNFPGGLAMVGERGPELVNLPRGSQVIPNNQLANLAPQNERPIEVNQYIQQPIDLDFTFRELAYVLRTS